MSVEVSSSPTITSVAQVGARPASVAEMDLCHRGLNFANARHRQISAFPNAPGHGEYGDAFGFVARGLYAKLSSYPVLSRIVNPAVLELEQ